MNLICDKCGERVSCPFDYGDKCFCGGMYVFARKPFLWFGVGCTRCRHMSRAVREQYCFRGSELLGKSCGEAGDDSGFWAHTLRRVKGSAI
jgi:hypothetical protein